MTIETAQFVVQRAGVQLKCTGADLATKLQAGDLMAVTRPGDDTYKWVRPATSLTYEFTVNVQDKEFYISTQTRAEYNGYDTTVDWGDSTVETITTPWNRTHRYLANGIYNIKITVKEGTPFALYGGSTNDQYKWLSIDSVDVNWNWGSSLLSSWQSCRELTSFPLINPSTVNNFQQAWENCSNLTSFPSLDYSLAKNMDQTWYRCNQLSDFPANAFDVTGTLKDNAFASTFTSCALTVSSIENILTSLDTNGQSDNSLGINSGTNASKSTWTTAANTAYDNLIAKGWTVSFNS